MIMTVTAAYHSICLYFICSNICHHETLDGSNGQVYGRTWIGNMIYFSSLIVVILKSFLLSTEFTWIHFLLIGIQPLFFIGSLTVYSNISGSFGGLQTGQAALLFNNRIFWVVTFLVPFFVVTPDFLWRFWENVVLQGRETVKFVESKISDLSLQRMIEGERKGRK